MINIWKLHRYSRIYSVLGVKPAPALVDCLSYYSAPAPAPVDCLSYYSAPAPDPAYCLLHYPAPNPAPAECGYDYLSLVRLLLAFFGSIRNLVRLTPTRLDTSKQLT